MTDLSNGHPPTNPDIPASVSANGMSPSIISRMPEIREPKQPLHIHPKQAHLDALIHASVVTHLIKVENVPDPLFALSQMQELPEVSFAAFFDDGLVALGCHSTLPEELARIAVPAAAIGPKQQKIGKGLQRIEEVSKRLETLVDTMQPEETILTEQLGSSILDRLSSLEAQVAKTAVAQPSPGIAILQSQMSALEDRLVKMPDPTEKLSTIGASLAELKQSSEQAPQLAEQQKQLDECASAILNAVQQMETATADVKSQSNAFLSDPKHEKYDQAFAKLTDLLPQFEQGITALSKHANERGMDADQLGRSVARSMQTTLVRLPGTEVVTDKIDQLGAAQRMAFTRIEAALTKAMSGLAPALDHLNARADDTENMMSDWHKDLKTLSLHTRAIADSTEQLPPTLLALEGEFAKLANRPEPVLDLSAQKESLADFSTLLATTLTEIEGIAQRTGDKTMALSDETIATLQTLPKLISATLRHEIDLDPIEDNISALKTELTALPENLNLSAIAAGLAAISDQIAPINDLQSVEFEGLRSSTKTMLSRLQNLTEDMAQLQAKDPDLDPVKDLIMNVQAQLDQSSQNRDGQLSLLQDTLAGLARHFGLAPPSAPTLMAASQLAPETSLNTLRMEFADLISKRMKENRAPLSDQAHQSSAG